MISRLLAIAAMTVSLSATAKGETFDEFASPFNAPDLKLPTEAGALGSGRKSMMFKPDGAGPFPALVIMPTCTDTSIL